MKASSMSSKFDKRQRRRIFVASNKVRFTRCSAPKYYVVSVRCTLKNLHKICYKYLGALHLYTIYALYTEGSNFTTSKQQNLVSQASP